MPTIEEVISKLGHAKYFSKLDLTKDFHQIPIHVASMDKTTFFTPFVKLLYKRLPFSLLFVVVVVVVVFFKATKMVSGSW